MSNSTSTGLLASAGREGFELFNIYSLRVCCQQIGMTLHFQENKKQFGKKVEGKVECEKEKLSESAECDLYYTYDYKISL